MDFVGRPDRSRGVYCKSHPDSIRRLLGAVTHEHALGAGRATRLVVRVPHAVASGLYRDLLQRLAECSFGTDVPEPHVRKCDMAKPDRRACTGARDANRFVAKK